MSYKWAEDDFHVPPGVGRLDLSAPEDGKTYVMYHGTARRNVDDIWQNGFKQSEDGMLGPGVYLSRDLQKASRYPIGHPEHDRVVIKVLVEVGRVIAINYQGHPLQKTWHPKYDTAWVPPNCRMVESNLEEDCVWDPSRIKILGFIWPKPIRMSFRWAENASHAGIRHQYPSAPRDGETCVMYYGTTRRNVSLILVDGFKRSEDGILGPGVYLSRDLQKASRYPIYHPEHDIVIIQVLVKMGRVFTFTYLDHPLQRTWRQNYDTAWVPPNCWIEMQGLEEVCVCDPDRIKIVGFIWPKLVCNQPGCACNARGNQ